MQPLVRSLQLSSLHTLSGLTLLTRYEENCHLFRLRIPAIVIGLATVLLLACLNSLALYSRLGECVVCDIFPTEPDDLAYPAWLLVGFAHAGATKLFQNRRKANAEFCFCFANRTAME